MILVVLICGSMGGCMGFFISGGAEELLAEDLAKLLNLLFQRLPWWLVLAAAVLFLLDMAFQWLLLRRQEVKL